MIKDESIIGKRFGRTVALVRAGVGTNGDRLWECQCDCGTKHITSASSLVQKRVNSCGCLRRERLANGSGNRTHGKSNTPEYLAWDNAQRRCDPLSTRHRKDYADRGITFWEGWKGPDGFQKFIDHIGLRPPDKDSLDRIDNDKSYEPGNVRWATAQEQVENRRKPLCIQKFSDVEFLAEARRRGFALAPQTRVYKAITISANAPTVGSIILVDASR